MEPIPIDLDLVPGEQPPRHVRIRAGSMLQPPAFRALRAALADISIPIHGARCVSFEHFPQVITALRAARVSGSGEPLFHARIAPEVLRARSANGVGTWLNMQGVDERISSIGCMFPYQQSGTRWLAQRATGSVRGALLADEPGLGKTLSTIAAIPTNSPVLIVCPTSLKGNWRGEFAKWRPQIPVVVLQGKKAFRWPKHGEVLAINFDVLPDIHDREGVTGRKCDGFLDPVTCRGCKKVRLAQRGTNEEITLPNQHETSCTGLREEIRPPCLGCHPFLKEVEAGTVIVIDEAHYAKNAKAQRTMALYAISTSVRTAGGTSWVLTGTPLENNPRELWMVLELGGLGVEAFGSFVNFRKIFKEEANPSGYGFIYTPPDPDTMKEKLGKVMLRRMKDDVQSQLPEKMYAQYIVDVRPEALAACDAVLQEHGGIDRITTLLQREAFPFELLAAARSALALAKIPALMEFVDYWEKEKPSEPLVVFGHHLPPLKKLALRKGWGIISGDEPQERRTQTVLAFQEGKLRGIAASIRAAGMGLTLTRANTAVFIERDFTSTKNQQAEDRIHRIGQEGKEIEGTKSGKRGVQYITFVANHMLERRLAEIIENKTRMIAATVDVASTDSGSTATNSAWFKAKRGLDHEVQDGDLRKGTVEELRTLSLLIDCRWESQAAGTIAAELVEEAEQIGLTDGGWALVQELYSKRLRVIAPVGASGVEVLLVDAPKKKPKDEKALLLPSVQVQTEHVPEQPTEQPAKRVNMPEQKNVVSLDAKRQQKERRREMKAAVMEVEKILEKAQSPEDKVQLVSLITDMLDEQSDEFCFGCGDLPHDEGEDCPADEDEDDEDDGEGLPDGDESEPDE